MLEIAGLVSALVERKLIGFGAGPLWPRRRTRAKTPWEAPSSALDLMTGRSSLLGVALTMGWTPLTPISRPA